MATAQPPLEKRLVTVTAVVMTEKTEGPEDVAESLEVTALALRGVAHRRRTGRTGPLTPIEYPLVRFEARSEPVPDGEAAGLSVTDLRILLDEATRLLYGQVSTGSEAARVQSIRAQAGLERL
jgi:hypothetical protein